MADAPVPEAPPEPAARADHRRYRPYRRFVGLLFALAIAALAALILRGIIRTLDRLPSAATHHRLDLVDDRALRACAEDLERLGLNIRAAAARAISASPGDEDGAQRWQVGARGLETERLRIVARCHLEDSTDDPAQKALGSAARALEEMLRSFSLLIARHEQSGVEASIAAQAAIARALETLRSRR